MIDQEDAKTRAELLSGGESRRGLARKLRTGALIRVRRDRYMHPDGPQAMQDAVRIGGRLTCVSLLQHAEVFVFENQTLHVHVTRGASRLRSVDREVRRLEPRSRRGQRLHWLPLMVRGSATGAKVGILDALAHSVLCQPPRYAIATLDSALNKRLVSRAQLGRMFEVLPARFAVLEGMIDERAESGPETLVRLMARALGCRVDLQVRFRGVGRVDLVLDGWLVVECDSKEFHEDWAQQQKDRKRDLELAALGYVTLRLTAAQIMYRPDDVVSALRGAIEAHRACNPSRRVS